MSDEPSEATADADAAPDDAEATADAAPADAEATADAAPDDAEEKPRRTCVRPRTAALGLCAPLSALRSSVRAEAEGIVEVKVPLSEEVPLRNARAHGSPPDCPSLLP